MSLSFVDSHGMVGNMGPTSETNSTHATQNIPGQVTSDQTANPLGSGTSASNHGKRDLPGTSENDASKRRRVDDPSQPNGSSLPPIAPFNPASSSDFFDTSFLDTPSQPRPAPVPSAAKPGPVPAPLPLLKPNISSGPVTTTDSRVAPIVPSQPPNTAPQNVMRAPVLTAPHRASSSATNPGPIGAPPSAPPPPVVRRGGSGGITTTQRQASPEQLTYDAPATLDLSQNPPKYGRSPSGRMIVSKSPVTCQGYNVGSIDIFYLIPKGKQRAYHPNPGRPYDTTRRKAFLPATIEGGSLVRRLQYAFVHGLTFTVGTSKSTGKPNSVIWATIPHKTSIAGGTPAHGFPDPGYFERCNQELNRLGVPSHQDCIAWYKATYPKRPIQPGPTTVPQRIGNPGAPRTAVPVPAPARTVSRVTHVAPAPVQSLPKPALHPPPTQIRPATSVGGAVLAPSSGRAVPPRNTPQGRMIAQTRILMKFLEQKDPPLYEKAKAVVRDCAQRHKANEPGYHNASEKIQERLKLTVGEEHWKRAESCVDRYMETTAKTRGGATSRSQQPVSVAPAPVAPAPATLNPAVANSIVPNPVAPQARVQPQNTVVIRSVPNPMARAAQPGHPASAPPPVPTPKPIMEHPKVKSLCLEILQGLKDSENGWVFSEPVDPVELGLDDYFDVIKKPMDLGTVEKNLALGLYQSIGSFKADVKLTFENAITYNPEGSPIYLMAEALKTAFAKDSHRLDSFAKSLTQVIIKPAPVPTALAPAPVDPGSYRPKQPIVSAPPPNSVHRAARQPTQVVAGQVRTHHVNPAKPAYQALTPAPTLPAQAGVRVHPSTQIPIQPHGAPKPANEIPVPHPGTSQAPIPSMGVEPQQSVTAIQPAPPRQHLPSQPLQPHPRQPQPLHPQPGQPQPVNPQPIRSQHVQPQPVHPQHVQPQPVHPQHVQPQPGQPPPVHPQPVQVVRPQPVKPQGTQSQATNPPPMHQPVQSATGQPQSIPHQRKVSAPGGVTPSAASQPRLRPSGPLEKKQMIALLRRLQFHKEAWLFYEPVNPLELGLTDYLDVVKKPMDLGTVRKKVESGAYGPDEAAFRADVNLTFDNALLYNQPGNVIYETAKELKNRFESDFKRILTARGAR